MTDPTNAVLNEKIKAMDEELKDFKKNTNKKIDDVNEKVAVTKELADEVSFTLVYMKESMDNVNNNMTEFITIVGDQNDKIDKSVANQDKQFNEFVNSDRKLSGNREFLVSILQVASGIIIAVLGFWSYNQF